MGSLRKVCQSFNTGKKARLFERRSAKTSRLRQRAWGGRVKWRRRCFPLTSLGQDLTVTVAWVGRRVT